jgi:hypothetical protein
MSIIKSIETPSAANIELSQAAQHEFEPWVRGLESAMTPAALHEAAGEHFMTTYFAYETMFRTKEDLIEAASTDDGFEAVQELLASLDETSKWFEMMSGLITSANVRLLTSLAAAALAGESEAVQ